MPSLQDLRNSFSFQRKAKSAQKELKNIHVEAEASGVMVVMSAAMEPIAITIADTVPRERIAPLLLDALKRVMKKAQIVSADKMQGVMGEMGLGSRQ